MHLASFRVQTASRHGRFKLLLTAARVHPCTGLVILLYCRDKPLSSSVTPTSTWHLHPLIGLHHPADTSRTRNDCAAAGCHTDSILTLPHYPTAAAGVQSRCCYTDIPKGLCLQGTHCNTPGPSLPTEQRLLPKLLHPPSHPNNALVNRHK